MSEKISAEEESREPEEEFPKELTGEIWRNKFGAICVGDKEGNNWGISDQESVKAYPKEEGGDIGKMCTVRISRVSRPANGYKVEILQFEEEK